MTQQEKQIKRYLGALDWQLALPKKDRARICADVHAELCARMEQGESFESAVRALGGPAALAQSFNEEMAAPARSKASPWRFAFLALGVLALGALAVQLTAQGYFLSLESASVGIIGGADGPTAIYVTSCFPMLWFTLPFVFGCAAAYLLCRAGRGGPRGQYAAAAVLGGAGLAAWLVCTALTVASSLPGSVHFTAGALAALPLKNVLFWPAFGLPLGALILAVRALRRGRPC